jgi:Cu-Zn family superoxide dismutase
MYAGQAKFTATKGGVQMSVTVTNLSPGVHAIHIHEAGKCDAPGFTTAGGHFNPANKQHGTQNPEGHHAGDLPNLTVGANGKGAFKSTIQNVIGYDLVSSSDSRGERHIEVSS